MPNAILNGRLPASAFRVPARPAPEPAADRLLVPLAEAARMLSISLRTMARLAADERVKTLLIGRRRLVVVADLHRLIAELGGAP